MYNGVEYEETLGLNLYEMDVRMYDPTLGRFNGIDPVTHFSQGTSVAFDNNPIYWADPSGANSTAEWMEKNGLTEDDLINVFDNSSDNPSRVNADGSNNKVDDDITVNSDGIVTKVVKNNKPHRFFDESGNELFFNDPEYDLSDINQLEKGDRLFFNITNTEMLNAILKEGGLDPLYQRYLPNGIGAAWMMAAFQSHGGADFTFSYLVPTYFTNSEKSYLEEGVLRTSYKSNEHFFRFGNTNNIYNLYDAGNYLWGGWMKLNGFRLGSIKFGSQVNELRKFSFDSNADQRAIENGFNHFKKK